jgi:parallel beta-helix repeat protein
MKKFSKYLVACLFCLFLLGLTVAFGLTDISEGEEITACTAPSSGMSITTSTTFCPGRYNLTEGIKVVGSNINILCNNTILHSTPHSGIGVNITGGLRNITIEKCKVQYFGTGIKIGRNSTGIKIINNTLLEFGYGIDAESLSSSIISKNLLDSASAATNTRGVNLEGTPTLTSWNNTISYNTISLFHQSASVGMFSYYGGLNNITGNNFMYTENGLILSRSSNNLISYNDISDNFEQGEKGIALMGSSYNEIFNNSVHDYYEGIELTDIYEGNITFLVSAHNNIINNSIFDNHLGADMRTGEMSFPQNNILSSNKFTNNDVHASGEETFYANVSGKLKGNYWDDAINLCIYDVNYDNYGDWGRDYPYSWQTSNKVLQWVEDYAPITNKTQKCGDNCCWGSETCSNCATDCGICPPPVCGNHVCEGSESCLSCSTDCGLCPGVCGNGICESSAGERCDACTQDCGECWICTEHDACWHVGGGPKLPLPSD